MPDCWRYDHIIITDSIFYFFIMEMVIYFQIGYEYIYISRSITTYILEHFKRREKWGYIRGMSLYLFVVHIFSDVLKFIIREYDSTPVAVV